MPQLSNFVEYEEQSVGVTKKTIGELQEAQVRLALRQGVWKEHPEVFAKEVFDITLEPHQIEILHMVRDYMKSATASCHSIGKCIGLDELVLTVSGLKKAKDLLNTSFEILSFDEKTGKQVIKKAWATDNGVQPVYKIKTDKGKEIIRTNNHPLWAGDFISGRRVWNRELKKSERMSVVNKGWTNTEDIKVGNVVLCPNSHEIKPTKFNFTDDQAKLLGYFLGDGGTTINASFTQEEGKTREEFINIIQSLGCEYRVEKSNSMTIVVSSTGEDKGKPNQNYVLNLLRKWDLLGHKSTEKKIPDFVFQLPKTQIALVLNRLFICDSYACVNTTKRKYITDDKIRYSETSEGYVGITLANEVLIDQIRYLLLRFGINVYKRYKPSKCNGKTFHAWELKIIGEDLKIFADKIGIFGKEEDLDKVVKAVDTKNQDKTKKWRNQSLPFDKNQDYHWEKVVEAEYLGMQPTICISVEDTHTFLTDFVEHNSFCSAIVAMWFLVSFYDPSAGCKVIITAPTFDQVKEAIFSEIDFLYKKANLYLEREFGWPDGIGGRISKGQTVCRLEYNKQNFIKGGSSDTPDNLVGPHAKNMLIIVDEAAGVKDEIFAGLEGILMSGEETKLLLLGNPVNITGTFFNAFGENSDYATRKVSAFETPNFKRLNITREMMHTDEWKQKVATYTRVSLKDKVKEFGEKLGYEKWATDARKRLPCPFLVNPMAVYSILRKCGFNEKDPQYLGRVLAEFPTETSSSLIPLDWWNLSSLRYGMNEYWNKGKVEFGIDTSGGDGKDFSTVAIRNGNKLVDLIKVKLNTRKFSNYIRDELYPVWKPSLIKIEMDGIGKAVYDNLLEDGLPVFGIMAGGGAGIKGAPDEEQKKAIFVRKRDEVHWNIREKLDPHQNEFPLLFPENKELTKQMRVMTYKKQPNGKIKIVDKEEIRKNLKISPDDWDACAMAFADVEAGDPFAECGFHAWLF